jgi:hypothetical protein
MPLPEIAVQNAVVWTFDRVILDVDYARISPSTMWHNLTHGFVWDKNHYAVNFAGHPYQGNFYFNAARSSGYGFYPSLLWTGFGSLTWEFFMEAEEPSINDLVLTTVGGATVGEILNRLSVEADFFPVSFVLNPQGTLNRYFFGGPRRQGKPVSVEYRLGAGSHLVNQYSYAAGPDVEDTKLSWENRTLNWALDLDYGIRGSKAQKPFDRFSIRYNQFADKEGTTFDVFLTGVLHNFARGTSDDWMEGALVLNYDVNYGNMVKMGANTLGASIAFGRKISDKYRLFLENQAGWVFIGASDFNYTDALIALDSSFAGKELRDYQLSMGASVLATVELSHSKWWRVGMRNKLYLLNTMPGSEPHYGTRGWDIVASHAVLFELKLPRSWRVGYEIQDYWKIAAYRMFAPMMRNMATNSLFVGKGF